MNNEDKYTERTNLEQIEYAIYLRKSRADLELEKYSKTDTLKRHRVILVNLAKSLGIDENKIRIYEEVVSGETIKEREEMQKLLENIECKKYKAIFVVEISRLSRGDKIDQGEITKILKYTNTLVITPDKTYDLNNEKDEELFEDELTNSSKELKVTKKRLNRGRNSSVLEGKYVASIAPYGYNRKKIEDDKGYTLEENPSESIVVKKVFNMYVYDNLSICGIARELNKSGYKPRFAQKWSVSTITDMLKNPIYIGQIRWNHRKTVKVLKNRELQNTRPRNNNYTLVEEGLHKGIISQEIWNLAQSKSSKNTPPVQHNNVLKNPLSHILICEKCGSFMQRRPYTKRGETTSIQCNNTSCNNISSKLHIVEYKIIEGLRYWLKNYKIDEKSIHHKIDICNITYYQTSIKRLNETLEINKKRLTKVCEAYEDGTYDKEIYQNRFTEIRENIIQIENQIKECESEINKEQQFLNEKETIIPKIENVLDVYYKLESAEEKNRLLKTVVEKVTYLKVKKTLKKTDDPTDFEIHIYPKIPKH